ncbi:MAG: hypothetical protein EA377_08585 [Phycisphaerales bacterium]|nr:MAG: hypothetical protein EA377_08585 [Phycisphaerales bacterium]
MMAEQLSGIDRRASEAAMRLRLLQDELADLSPEQREQYLVEELERTLHPLVPDEREQFLAKILERFPCWDRVNGELRISISASAGSETNSVAGGNQSETPSAESLAQQLVSQASGLDDESLQRIQRILSEAGLTGSAPSSVVTSQFDVREFAGKLPLPAGTEQIDSHRVAALMRLLHTELGKIVELTWTIFRQIEPKPGLKPERLEMMVAKFLTTDDPRIRKQLEARISELSKLAAVLLSSLPFAWRIAQQEAEKIAPVRIEQAVPKSIFFAREQGLWKKYCELAAQHKLEQIIRGHVVEYVRDQLGQKMPRSASRNSV